MNQEATIVEKIFNFRDSRFEVSAGSTLPLHFKTTKEYPPSDRKVDILLLRSRKLNVVQDSWNESRKMYCLFVFIYRTLQRFCRKLPRAQRRVD